MAVKSTFVGNTAWVGELETVNRKDASGTPYQAKSILFRVATRREYSITREVNGEQIKERPTDFISCKATGHVAQLIKDYASARKTDGSLQSRVLEVSGRLETYKTKKEDKKLIERTEKRRINVGGQIYEIDFPISVESVHEVEYWQSMFMVDSINFWDSNNSDHSNAVTAPTKTLDTSAVISAMPVTDATPVADVTPVTNIVAEVSAKAEVIAETPTIVEEVLAPKVEVGTTPTVSIPSDILEESPF